MISGFFSASSRGQGIAERTMSIEPKTTPSSQAVYPVAMLRAWADRSAQTFSRNRDELARCRDVNPYLRNFTPTSFQPVSYITN
jgi:hypothetical protein